MSLFSLETSPQIGQRHPPFAALPIGACEQHGAHLPITTDTLIATEVARRLCDTHGGLLLPPIGISCSHEHAGFPGTLSLSTTTLVSLVQDTLGAVARQGIGLTVVVNGHGGNYALSNVTQEANVDDPRVLLALTRHHWEAAAAHAGIESSITEDMHGGEMETSILLHCLPEAVRMERAADWSAPKRPLLTLFGMPHYTTHGIIGHPSRATAEKGRKLLEGLVEAIGKDTRTALEAVSK